VNQSSGPFLLIGVGSRRRSASQAIDLPSDGGVTLGRHEILDHTHVVHEPRKLPVVLSPEEVARLLNAAPGLKCKAALSVAYGAGLRAAEVVSLKVSDIDSKRLIIRVEQGNVQDHSIRRPML
jgi:integrase